MRISDWSSDVCSSDLLGQKEAVELVGGQMPGHRRVAAEHVAKMSAFFHRAAASGFDHMVRFVAADPRAERHGHRLGHDEAPRRLEILEHPLRSAEHTSELQSLMRISYAVFCLKK